MAASKGQDVEMNSFDNNGRRYSEGGDYVDVAFNGGEPYGNDDDEDNEELYILDDQDEDLGLLDWDQYARIRRKQCCGVSCPDFASVAPVWWYKLPKNRRRQISAILPALAFVLLLSVICAFLFSSPSGGSAKDEAQGGLKGDACSASAYVLPTTFEPMHYDVDLSVGWNPAETMDVSGAVKMYFKPSKVAEGLSFLADTQCLVLHAGANVEVGAIDVHLTDGSHLKVKGRRYDEATEQLVVDLGVAISPNQVHHVHVDFSYALAESMRGFYRSNYRDSKNVTHTLASTQFEAADARRAFPCFDQPNMKATFDFTLAVKRLRESVTSASDNFQVLFNTPVKQGGYGRTYEGDYAIDTYSFETTPKMSTYLVAFVIGDLVKQTKVVDGGRVVVNVWGTPEHGNDLGDALESCVRILPAYETLFDIPFPLKKLDLVAIPSFEAGAMENWGLITYRESSLLVNPEEASDFDVMWATTTVAHELVHMWFGNLVTMDWWNDLYLNEGFAEYIQYIGVTVAKPDYQADTLFNVFTAQTALSADSYANSHPLHVPYEETLSSIEIDGLFDGITYDKGASVIRMLRAKMSQGKSISSENLLKLDPFIQGLRAYLKEYSYQNTKSSQFWQAMSESIEASPNAPDMDVVRDMQSWISIPNYPLLRLSWKTEPTGTSPGVLQMAQAPYQKGGLESCSADKKWWVPFSYVTSSNPDVPVSGVLSECASSSQDPTSYIALRSPKDWVKLNPNQSGFYRVNYPRDMWSHLAEEVEDGDLGSVDVSNLIDDAYALVGVELEVSVLLDLAAAASKRKPLPKAQTDAGLSDYQAWRGVSFAMNAVEGKLEGSSCHADFKKFVHDSVTDAIASYDFVPSLTRSNSASIEGSFQHRMLIGLLFSLGVEFGDDQVSSLATSSFGGAKVHPNLRYAVYKATARSGVSGYNSVLDRYRRATDADEKEKLMLALGSVLDKNLIQKSLSLAMSDDIESMDVRSFMGRIASSGLLGRELTWKYLQENFDALYEKVNGSLDVASSRLAGLVSRVCGGFATDARLREVQSFYEKYEKWIPVKIFHKIEESIRTNKAWLERNEKGVCDWERKQREG